MLSIHPLSHSEKPSNHPFSQNSLKYDERIWHLMKSSWSTNLMDIEWHIFLCSRSHTCREKDSVPIVLFVLVLLFSTPWMYLLLKLEWKNSRVRSGPRIPIVPTLWMPYFSKKEYDKSKGLTWFRGHRSWFTRKANFRCSYASIVALKVAWQT